MTSRSTKHSRLLHNFVLLAGTLLLLALFAQPSLAAQFNYGNFMGTHITYANVTEDTGADPLALFGSPTVTGNSIDFNPIGFDASTTGAVSDITDGNLVFMVTAKSGSRIRRIILTESGDTTLAGNVTPGSMGTASSVFGSGMLDIHEVDFQGINHISVPFQFTYNPSGGTYFLGTDGGGGPLFNTQWNGSVTLDIEAILIANGIPIPPGTVDPDTGATKISIDLDDTLVAVSQSGTASLIEKKDFSALVVRANVPQEPGGGVEGVPEPTTIALSAFAALGLVLAYRRRRVPGSRSEARNQ